jgi:uncharacterized protein
VVILNVNSGYGDDGKANPWPDSIKTRLEAFVAAGGGLVNTHATFPSFYGWAAFDAMRGLYWRDLDDKGPGYHLDVRDSLVPIPGSEDSGSYESFTLGGGGELMGVLNAGHPINLGLPPAWLHPKDNLVNGLKGSPEGVTVLSYAVDTLHHLRQPQQWVKHYGQGRIFTNALGHLYYTHANTVYRCAGYQTTFIRGAEWAAAGRVTYPVPADFPGKNVPSLRDNLPN